MAAAAILDCWIRKILLADGVQRAQTHHCTIFRQNQSFRWGDIVIFLIFKMAAVAILYFWNREILLAIGVERAEMHQHSKFRQNQSIGCKDIKIFRFFKMAAAAILDCRIRKFFGWRCPEWSDASLKQISSKSVLPLRRYCDFSNFQNGRRCHLEFLKSWHFIGYWLERVERYQRDKFCQNRSISCIILRFFDFSRWRPSAILDSFVAHKINKKSLVLTCVKPLCHKKTHLKKDCHKI